MMLHGKRRVCTVRTQGIGVRDYGGNLLPGKPQQAGRRTERAKKQAFPRGERLFCFVVETRGLQVIHNIPGQQFCLRIL